MKDYLFLDFGFYDPNFLSLSSTLYDDDESQRATSPPKHRHDGTSPLPLGMDWSPPPRLWDGHDTIWPHDSHTGWSYCATIPSILSRPRGSATVVFYRVQIGIQSPDGFTTTREILRRFSDFLKLSAELKKEFPKKKLPPAPSKGLLRMQSNELLEERRCLLEDWMTKVLSVVEISRSAAIGIFLELEAAARSSFYELNQNVADVNSSISAIPSIQFSNGSDISLVAGPSSFASDCGNDSAYGTPELGSPTEGGRSGQLDNAAFYQGFTHLGEAISEDARLKNGDGKPAKDSERGNQENNSKMPSAGDDRDVSTGRVIDSAQAVFKDEMEVFSGRENHMAIGHVKQTLETDVFSERMPDISNFLKLEPLRNTSHDPAEGSELLNRLDAPANSNLQLPDHLQVVIQLDEKNKMHRVLSTMQLRLATAKTDMEDLLMRFDQELAVRQYLATKVRDLEIELESLKHTVKENLQQAVINEREKFTQMLWDMEELRRKGLEMELKLTSEQADKVQMESTQRFIIQENERLDKELDAAQQQVNSFQKHHLESESKSKGEVKLLVKEIKSLRSSHTELMQELSKLEKEKAEVEMILREERQSREHANAANMKLLHECEILRSRLEECSISFLIEEENKLVLDASNPSNAIDILLTSDNRIGLLLAEAQLLAQDAETTIASRNLDGGYSRTAMDDLRKLLADVYVDNAKLRKQMNSVIRYALQTADRSKENEQESPPTKTALKKFLGG